jgi:hemerythrin superfamily protein
MTIFKIIKEDHKKIKTLLDKLDKTTEKTPEKREKFFSQFKQEMTRHAKSEERCVYVPLKAKQKTRPISFEGYEEHALVDYLIPQLDAMNKSDETWTAKMTVLKELIEHHVKEEESEMFEKMRKAFDTDELNLMAEKMVVTERHFKTSPRKSKPAKLPTTTKKSSPAHLSI